METKVLSPANCQDLEDSWRLRVELKHHAYRMAVAHYGRLITELSEVHSPDHPGSAVEAARDATAQALREYVRVLRIFTALTIDKKLPEETIAREAANA